MANTGKQAVRGRPPGRTAQGEAMRERIYVEALRLFSSKGFEQATLREIAQNAGVSAALLYKYFPSKQAVVLELYKDLSAKYLQRAGEMPRGTWQKRYLFALKESLGVLRPHRSALSSLAPILVSDPEQGVFGAASEFSRIQIEQAFVEAVMGASDAPASEEDALALGRLLYVSHLAAILWWLLDRSPAQRATAALLDALEKLLPVAAWSFRLGKTRKVVRALAGLSTDALFGAGAATRKGPFPAK